MSDCINIAKDIKALNISEDDKITLQLQRNMSELNKIDRDATIVKDNFEHIMQAEDPIEAFVNFFRIDRGGKAGKFTDADGNEISGGLSTLGQDQDTIRNEMHAILNGLMEDHRPSKFGYFTPFSKERRGRADFEIVKALFDKSNDADAKFYAKQWMKVYDLLGKRFDDAGGAGKKAAQFERVPVSHSVTKLQSIESDGKLGEYIDNLDDWLTAEAIPQVEDYSRREIIEMMFRREADDVGNIPGLQEHRIPGDPIFDFKDSDSWLKYNEMYGTEGGFYISMNQSVNSMAHIIAAMEKFGSAPGKGIDQVKELLRKDPTVNKSKMERRFTRIKNIQDVSMGALASNSSLAIAGNMIRNFQTAVKLGGAIIPAMTDSTLMIANARYNGFSGTKVFKRHMEFMSGMKNNAARHRLASRLLLGLEHMIDATHSASRYTNVEGAGFFAKAAGSVMSVTGLQGWTVAAKQAFGVEFGAHFSEVLKSGKIGAAEARALKQYGFNEPDIKRLKTAERFTDSGVEFIDPMKLPKGLKHKYQAMVQGETLMAVPEGDAGVQALLTGGAKQGGWVGEAVRFGTQFKIFPAFIISNHWQRVANKSVPSGDRLKYAATNIAGLTLMGMMAVQVRDMINGKEPRDFDDETLWIDGFVQGGAGSFAADLLISNIGKDTLYSGQFTNWLVGPTFGDAQKLLYDIAYKDIHADIHQKQAFAGYDATAVKMLDAIKPNIWQTKLLLQRAMMDPLNEMADPRWKAKQARKRTKMMRDENRDYWSKPGEFYQ